MEPQNNRNTDRSPLSERSMRSQMATLEVNISANVISICFNIFSVICGKYIIYVHILEFADSTNERADYLFGRCYLNNVR